MDLAPFIPFIPVAGPVAVALVATIAILVTRSSNQKNITKDIELKKWEKRAAAYLELLVMLDRQDPSNAPNLADIAKEAQDGPSQLTAVDLHSDEWRRFDIAVRLYASANVATLYWIWKRALAEWTMSRASLVVNEGNWEDSTPTEQEAFERELSVRNRLQLLRREVLLHVRSELDFRKRRLPPIRRSSDRSVRVTIPEYAADADMEVYVGNDPDYATDVRRGDGGWHVDVRMATGAKSEDMMKVENWSAAST